MSSADDARRPRRRRGELRGLLIETAREVFVESGYHGTTLRQIAIRAGTTQAVLYRYFPTKANLFEESVFRPFDEFVDQLLARWRDTPFDELSTEVLMGGFTHDLYEFTATHRGLMLALIAADVHGDDELADVRAAFAGTIAKVLDRVAAEAQDRGWADIDFEVASPLTIAMTISAALLDQWLFPAGASRPSDDRVLRELTRYQVRAVTGMQLRVEQ